MEENIGLLIQIIVLVLFVLFAIFYIILYSLSIRISTYNERKYRTYLTFSCFIILISISCSTLYYCGESVYIIALIGGIIAYWRYELSKYNKIARNALRDLTRIFQSEKLARQHRQRISCILMTLATFNNSNAWFETKRIINRFLGLCLDKEEHEFRQKTPRYFEELTGISKAINEDNSILGIVNFLPFFGFLTKDHYCKEWLDLVLELIIDRFEKDSLIYKREKTWCFLKKYIELGGTCTFNSDMAEIEFCNFLERNGIEEIYMFRSIFFLEYSNIKCRDIENHLVRTIQSVEMDDFLDDCPEWMICRIRKFLVEEKRCSKDRFKHIIRELADKGYLDDLIATMCLLEMDLETM